MWDTIHMVEMLLAIRELSTDGTAWMDLGNIVLDGKSRT